MKDALVCSLSAVNPIRPLILWRQSSLSYFVLCQSSYVVPSPLIMALSSRTITASINYRCAPFSATLMHRGRRAALKTPSDACAEDCRGKLILPRCPINACSPWCVPIITLRESVLTTKPRQRFSAVTCCTSNVNPPAGFHRHDSKTPDDLFTLFSSRTLAGQLYRVSAFQYARNQRNFVLRCCDRAVCLFVDSP